MLIDLLRHGETEASGLLVGRTDVALTDAGWRQFARQTERMAFDAVIASPRRRARLPAEDIAAARSVPLRIDADWAEIDFGAWDGCVLADLNGRPETAGALAAFYRSPEAAGPPGGEDWRELQERVSRALDRVLDCACERVLVSTHAGPIRAAVALTCAIPFGNLWALRVDPGTRVTLRVGRDATGGRWGEIIEVAQA